MDLARLVLSPSSAVPHPHQLMHVLLACHREETREREASEDEEPVARGGERPVARIGREWLAAGMGEETPYQLLALDPVGGTKG